MEVASTWPAMTGGTRASLSAEKSQGGAMSSRSEMPWRRSVRSRRAYVVGYFAPYTPSSSGTAHSELGVCQKPAGWLGQRTSRWVLVLVCASKPSSSESRTWAGLTVALVLTLKGTCAIAVGSVWESVWALDAERLLGTHVVDDGLVVQQHVCGRAASVSRVLVKVNDPLIANAPYGATVAHVALSAAYSPELGRGAGLVVVGGQREQLATRGSEDSDNATLKLGEDVLDGTAVTHRLEVPDAAVDGREAGG